MKAPLVATLLVAVALAGCADGPGIESTLADTPRFEEYTWPAPSSANGTDHPLLAEGVRPHVVQQVLPLAGVTQLGPYLFTYAPTLAATEDAVMVTVLDQVLRSRDGGVDWTVVHNLTSEGHPEMLDRKETAGNYLWRDADTGRTFLSHLNRGSCQYLGYSDDGGDAWEEPTTANWPVSCADSQDVAPSMHLSYNQKVFTGAPVGVAGNLAQYDKVLYFCESMPYTGPKCSVSMDSGATFLHQNVPVAPDMNCWLAGIGAPAAGPDGTVYVPIGLHADLIQWKYLPIKDCQFPPMVAVSEDNGLTWDLRTYGDASYIQREPTPGVTVTPDGTAYLVQRGSAPDRLDGDVAVFRSTDKFQTWEGPFRVTVPEHTLSSHPSIVSGSDGRVAVSYLASRTDQVPHAHPANATSVTAWHQQVAVTDDAGESWAVQQVTPRQDPVLFGCIGRFCQTQIGPYSSMAVAPDGRFYAAVIDACDPRNGCTTDLQGGYQAAERQITVSTLDSGLGLRGEPVEPFGLVHTQPLEKAE